MMKRSLRISLDKPGKTIDPAVEEGSYEDKIEYTIESIKPLIHESVKIVLIYVAVDTARKMLIELAKK